MRGVRERCWIHGSFNSESTTTNLHLAALVGYVLTQTQEGARKALELSCPLLLQIPHIPLDTCIAFANEVFELAEVVILVPWVQGSSGV